MVKVASANVQAAAILVYFMDVRRVHEGYLLRILRASRVSLQLRK
jgi:hypothetical protein